jgi:hypothetical protein
VSDRSSVLAERSRIERHVLERPGRVLGHRLADGLERVPEFGPVGEHRFALVCHTPTSNVSD